MLKVVHVWGPILPMCPQNQGCFLYFFVFCECHTPGLPMWFNELCLYIKVFILKPVTITHMPFCSLKQAISSVSSILISTCFPIILGNSSKMYQFDLGCSLATVSWGMQKHTALVLPHFYMVFMLRKSKKRVSPNPCQGSSLLLLIVLLQPGGVGESVWVDYFWHQLLT